MKVRVTFTVDVNVDEWSEEYGLSTAGEIRRDVLNYVENVIAGSYAFDGAGIASIVPPGPVA